MKFWIKQHKLPKRTACKRYDFSEPEQYTLELQNRFEALSTPESNNPLNMATEKEKGENCHRVGKNQSRLGYLEKSDQ